MRRKSQYFSLFIDSERFLVVVIVVVNVVVAREESYEVKVSVF